MPPEAEPAVTVADLHRALSAGEFQLYYQPRIALPDLKIAGAESLIRWVPKDGGRVRTPGAFLDLAEEAKLTPAMTLATFELLIQDAAKVRLALGRLTLSYNVSAHDLKHFEVVQAITEATRRGRISTDELELELTETSQFIDPLHLDRRLRALKNAGIALAMDDYGTGHSNLESLRHLPVKTIKLDQGVVKNIWTCEKARSIAWQTPRMARAAGLLSVAEGIEDAATLEFVRDAGFDQAQGYFMARPMPLDAFIEFAQNDWKPVATLSYRPLLNIAIEEHLAWRQMLLDLITDTSALRSRIGKSDMMSRLSDWFERLTIAFEQTPALGQLTVYYMRLRNLCLQLLTEEAHPSEVAHFGMQESFHRCSMEVVQFIMHCDSNDFGRALAPKVAL